MTTQGRPPELPRGRGVLVSLPGLLLAGTTATLLGAAVLVLLSGDRGDQIARAYARRLAVTSEDQCPQALGKAFWFSCAAEVRRLHPASGASSRTS